ncbi:MAG TPA: alpha-N-arabinofuranosidase [Roseateles sp.]|nr:alpha-N-arabinofuranosidase [Roseateles sp.]
MTFKASLTVDRQFDLAPLDRRLFGVFVEHLGRCVYSGIYEPGHPTADEQGFRGDVAALTRELGATIVRYPGGNFMSGYNWEGGVGPKDQRPRRLDLAWFSTESNQVGTHEFMHWCREVGIEPMFGVNLGTRGPDEARHYLEYCNHPGGTALSDLRRAHGAENPLGIKFWCLGNEMDGPWQICQKTPDEYGRIAKETAKLMRWVDPSIELAACGSSAYDMPTYGVWEDRVLEHCFEYVDFLSLHSYFVKPPADTSTESFFAQIETNARYIEDTVAVADAVATRKRSAKRLMLSFDEWNVWYRARHGEHMRQPGWPEAPRLLEEVYTAEDALLVGGMLTMMMNHADRLKVACLAQLCNVIAPIMTEPGGRSWKQTTFHPFALTSRHASGTVLQLAVESPLVSGGTTADVPALSAVATFDAEKGEAVVFAVNRSATDALTLDAAVAALGNVRVVEALTYANKDPYWQASADDSTSVLPSENGTAHMDGGRLAAELPAVSWSMIRLAVEA